MARELQEYGDAIRFFNKYIVLNKKHDSMLFLLVEWM